MPHTLVITRPLSPAERAALPDAWRALTTSTVPQFDFRDPPEPPRRRATDHPQDGAETMTGSLERAAVPPFVDDCYPHRYRTPLLPRVYPPSMAVTRRPRRDNADVAWSDQARRFAGRVAGPVAVAVLTIIITVALITPRAVAL
ncbi:hypothetical protein STAQ_28090 [Allostella sp. ATCC 35155]|nr:hypothetical protein STAQ_28090 [Stella sp. ATCC 35155]